MKRSLYQEIFPDNITITHKYTAAGGKCRKHIHENFEIMFITSDDATATINNGTYYLTKNTLALIKNTDMHWIRGDENKSFDRYVITFKPENLAIFTSETTNLLDCFYYRPFPHSQFFQLEDNQAEILKNQFNNLINLTNPNQKDVFGNDLSIVLSFANILLTINKYYRKIHGLLFMKLDNYDHKLVYSLINYLHSHFSEEVTLDTLSEYFEVDKYKLSKIYKSVTGIPPIQYLIKCRLENAKYLLQSDNSIEEVCFEVGFNNLSHFSKSFKNHYGKSPKNYQMEHRKI